jgi:hypothetical protein
MVNNQSVSNKIINQPLNMKKIIIILCILVISKDALSQPIVGGDIRVVLESITCVNKSWDSFVELDGPGSEVFINCGVFVRNPTSTRMRIFKQAFTGNSYGNTLPNAPARRVRAGTASQQGGIENGNSFSAEEQLFAVHLDADGVFYFSPSLWEWDNGNETIRNRFNTQLLADLESVSLMPIPYNFNDDNVAPDPNGNVYMPLSNAFGLSIPPNSYPGILKPLINTQDNRPMGMYAYAGVPIQFDPRIIVIKASNANKIFNLTSPPTSQQPSSFKPIRRYSVTFSENTYGVATSNGEYRAVFRIEFAPAYPDNPTTPPQPSQNQGKTLKTTPVINRTLDRPVNMTTKMTTKVIFTGNWSGNQTNDYGQYPQAISFQLTGSNEFLMTVPSTGAVAVRGTYITSGNSISGSYKQLSSGETFSFTGSFDSNTQKMICTIGSGTSVTGQGKWEVIKK